MSQAEINSKNLQDFLAAFKESPKELSGDLRKAAQKLLIVPNGVDINKKYESELESIIGLDEIYYKRIKDIGLDEIFYKKIKENYDKDNFEQFIINKIVADLGVSRDSYPNLDNTIIAARSVFYMQLVNISPTGKPLQKMYIIENIEGLSVSNDVLLILVFIFFVVVLRWKLDDIILEIKKMRNFVQGYKDGNKVNEHFPESKNKSNRKTPRGSGEIVQKKYTLVLLLGGDAPGLEGKRLEDKTTLNDVFELVDEYCEYYRIVEKAENIQPIPYNEGDMPMYWLQMDVQLHSIPTFKFFDHVEAFMKKHRGDKITIKKVSFASRKGFDKV